MTSGKGAKAAEKGAKFAERMATSAAEAVFVPSQRRELWLRQLMRKWGSLSNTGSSGFNRDIDTVGQGHRDQSDSDPPFDFREELDERLTPVLEELEPNEQHVMDVGSDSMSLRRVTNSSPLVRGQSETLRQQFIHHQQYRVAVHTWNVAGKPPPDDLDMEGWINNASLPADIYVFGFQEVVPLNANNVLSVEDAGPAAMWEARIRETLNKSHAIERQRTQLEKSQSVPLSTLYDVADVLVMNVPEISDVESLIAELNNSIPEEPPPHGNKLPSEFRPRETAQNGDRVCRADVGTAPPQREHFIAGGPKYSRVASKQMVGLFITVWIRSHLRRNVHNVQVSTVGCGLMNHLGNKGSISVSMFLHHTSFCFVCSHLTSGHKEGDALRRNADVAEILRRTRFPRLAKLLGLQLPETIIAHDCAIWLGDLNYRLALPDKETWTLVERGDWASLLRVDQLKLEQGEGRVFLNWQEGQIYFPPTYKYMNKSHRYHSSGNIVNPNSAASSGSSSSKRRSPAWCDRVLWYGGGLHQEDYTREEATLSDHRCVSATFTAEVEVQSRKKLQRACGNLVAEAPEVARSMLVVPTVMPLVDVPSLHSNEVWGSLLRTLTPPRQKLLELETNYGGRSILLDQDALFDASKRDGAKKYLKLKV